MGQTIRLISLAMVASLTLAGMRSAEADTAKAEFFTHGPSIPLFRIYFEKQQSVTGESVTDAKFSLLQAGAGYAFSFNLRPSADKTIRWFTISVPTFVSYNGDTKAFQLSTGLSMGTYNNLIGIGVNYNLFNVVDGPNDTGLFLDNGIGDLSILVNFSLNLGGGKPGLTSAGPPGSKSPPPNYIRLW